MNAKDESAFVRADRTEWSAGIEAWRIRTESIRLSSRALNWGPLNIERREMEPSDDVLPGGTTEHLIFVNLADQHVMCESDGEITDAQYAAGQIGIHPS